MRVTPRGVGRSVDRGVGGPGIEPRHKISPGCRGFLCSGRQHGGVRYRQRPAGPAWSEALARRRNLLSGNREISWLAVGERTVRVRQAGGPKLTMHGHEKSDPCIVAMKPANKGGQLSAELVEPRGLSREADQAEGNMVEHGKRRTPGRESMSHGLDRGSLPPGLTRWASGKRTEA